MTAGLKRPVGRSANESRRSLGAAFTRRLGDGLWAPGLEVNPAIAAAGVAGAEVVPAVAAAAVGGAALAATAVVAAVAGADVAATEVVTAVAAARVSVGVPVPTAVMAPGSDGAAFDPQATRVKVAAQSSATVFEVRTRI